MSDLIVPDDLVISGPALEPLDLEEVRKHLKISTTTEDTRIDSWISAATQQFEKTACLQLITATRERQLGKVPTARSIELPRPPLQAIVSVTSGDGSPATIMDPSLYRAVTPYETVGRIELIDGASWPAAPFRIRYRAGFGDAPGDVPELIREAIYSLVAYYHKFRAPVHEGANLQEVPLGMKEMFRRYAWDSLPTSDPLRSAASVNNWIWPWPSWV